MTDGIRTSLLYDLRAARSADGPRILAINRQSAPGVSALGAADVEDFLSTASSFRVAEHTGSIVGYLIALASDAPYEGEEFLWFKRCFDRFVYIDQVAVVPEGRGKGAASALYSGVETFARERQIPLLACEISLRPVNEPSLAFHARHGFSEVARLETRRGPWVSLMVKKCESSMP